MTRVCASCDGALSAISLPAGQHRSGPVTATADARHLVACPAHCRGSSDARLREALSAALEAGLLLASGTSTSPTCGRCRSSLDLPMRATVRSITVEPDLSAPFTVTFALPLARCGACDLDNVPPGVAMDVRESAMIACGLRTEERAAPGWFRWRRRRGAPGSP